MGSSTQPGATNFSISKGGAGYIGAHRLPWLVSNAAVSVFSLVDFEIAHLIESNILVPAEYIHTK